MRWTREYTPNPQRERLYRQALLVTGLGNLTLAVVKAFAAAMTGSAALYSDAANSISDVLYSVMMVLGLWVAQRPPDISHPQGHSRFEPLVGVVVSFSMTFAGYEAARTGIQRFIEGGSSVTLGLPALVLFFAMLVKTGMYSFINRSAKQLNSPTLATTAKDNLSDVLTSLAAFFGILGSQYLSPLTDPIAGVLVAVWIFRQAFMALRENLDFLTGAGASQDLREEIVRRAESVPGVLRVHHLLTEYVGPTLVVDLHVNVVGTTDLITVHDISEEVARQVEDLAEVDRAYVHIEPDDLE